MTPPAATPVSVVGIGADGWDGLSGAARVAVCDSTVLMGSARQLALVPDTGAVAVAWPTPLLPALPGLLDRHRAAGLCVLASGDPMFHGIGVTLARMVGPENLRVLPQPSSASLACARLGWPVAETPVVNLVARPVETMLPAVVHGQRLLLLSNDERSAAAIATTLTERGFGNSTMTVLEQLGGPAELRYSATAASWPHPPGDPLNVVAVVCAADAGTRRLTRMPGLPDAAFGGEGQFTKAEVRALTLSALAPASGELLWDVGGGSGSIAIEWCRSDPNCRAVTFEHIAARAERITGNALALGVPHISVRGRAPESFDDAPPPDAIFVGGGVTQDGLLDDCWRRLRPNGRMVVNAVTAEAEAVLLIWAGRRGGTLRRFQIYRAEKLGAMTMWQPKLPITQWSSAE